MKLLRQLLIGCCALLSLPEAAFADDIEINKPPGETVASSLNNSLNSEQMHYVLLECEGFAKEDDISSTKRPAYIKTCVKELSTAVKLAIKQLQAKSELPVVNNSNDNSLKD